MTSFLPSFTHWPYPPKKQPVQRCSWSPCGLFAHATNSVVVVYGEDQGNLSPLIIFPPFDQNISAISWYDASALVSQTVPLLLVATLSGGLYACDIRMRQVIPVLLRKAEYFTALQWSRFSDSIFSLERPAGP
jgi:hypothetical protein